jgi:hypothetical protein
LLTIEATITWPAAVPAGRVSVMLDRDDDEPPDDDATRAGAAVAGTAVTVAASSPTASGTDRRETRRGHFLMTVIPLRAVALPERTSPM